MELIESCPVCNHTFVPEAVRCPECTWESKLFDPVMQPVEYAAHLHRQDEAHTRWQALGRYDQAPRGIEIGFQDSSNNIHHTTDCKQRNRFFQGHMSAIGTDLL